MERKWENKLYAQFDCFMPKVTKVSFISLTKFQRETTLKAVNRNY